VSNEAEVESMFAEAIAAFGTLHIVVTTAGLQRDAKFDEMTLVQWQTVIGVNLTGQFLCQRAAVREFKRRGVDPYAASKGGVMMLMKSLAQEMAPYRIRVNSIGPGAIRTPINTA
jgi:glucose 1-dehydrogenase